MNDERLGKEIGEFYRETDAAPPDSKESARQVASRLTQAPQVKRRRWLPSWLQRSSPASIPVPTDDDHSPTVSGRTRSMLNPVTAITAGALVFAIGGAFLIAQPFEQQGRVPGAETQVVPTPVGFSSTYEWRSRSTPGSSETLEDGVMVVTGEGWAFSNLDSSDLRFAGPLAMTSNIFEYPGEGSISVGGYRVETADGAWQQVPVASLIFETEALLWRNGHLPPADNIQFGTFVGEGDYEGLIAVYQETWWPDGGDEVTIRLDGYVIDGDLPGAPEPWMP